jgi:hypothetical protein
MPTTTTTASHGSEFHVLSAFLGVSQGRRLTGFLPALAPFPFRPSVPLAAGAESSGLSPVELLDDEGMVTDKAGPCSLSLYFSFAKPGGS